ncbi:MAG: AAA family ATPase [Actinomycetes bacterium]
MECPGCGAEVSSAAKFCAECGRPQQAVCSSCATPVAAGAKFCSECGTPVGSAPPAAVTLDVTAAPVAERRVCSVLFCDLVGFTPLSESRDPEEVRELLSRYFETARTVIGRYGGVVEKFIGDAVMAVWGAPVAAEGDAERAVRAGLEVIDAVFELGRQARVDGLAARAGVVTGEMAVTIGATGEGMVAGDAVNTASRVQAAAEAGAVLVDEGTWRVARGAVAFTDAGEHILKGKVEAAPLWRAERVLSGVGGAQRVDGLEAPLVGRDAELRLIKELFHACVDRRSPRLVSVTGPAGVGKSRLGWEFFKYIDGLANTVWWHRGRCLSYGEGVAFWALAEMVRQRLGIAEDETSSVIAEKLATGLAEQIPDATTRAFVGPTLERLLGVETEGAGLARDELFAGWRVFFEILAGTSPVVLLLEDLHYADEGLLDFVEHLLDWSRDVPILVVTLARSELGDRRASWGIGRNSTVLGLEPLDDASMRDMLEGLVPGMPDAAATAIARQAQGIPLYAVETVRMLVDRDVVQPIDGIYRLVGDVGELAVPDTLQSLLAARLDALEPAARRLIADAAVLGGSFPAEALVAVSELTMDEVQALLAELVRREVLAVRADPLSPDRGQYGFVQNMFRQVAYDTLSRRERKARHLQVADHLARAFADDGEEVSEVIAQHLLDALGAVPDDPDIPGLRERAVDGLVRAADRAERTAAFATASSAFLRAAALCEDMQTLPGDLRAAELYQRAGVAAGIEGDQQASGDYSERAVALYDRHEQRRLAAQARTTVGSALRRQGRLEEARTIVRRALDDLMAEGRDGEDIVLALAETAQVELQSGTDEALTIAHDALRRAEALGLEGATLVRLLVVVGMAARMRNARSEATAFLREALRLSDAVGNTPGKSAAGLNLADVLVETDAAAAVEVAQQSVVDARRTGNRFLLPTTIANLVLALLLTGDWDRAEEECNREVEPGRVPPMVAYVLAFIHALRGRLDGLDELVAVVVESAPAEDAQEQAGAACTQALASFARGDHAETIAHTMRALEVAAGLGPSHETVRWSWPVGVEAALALGDLARAEQLLTWVDAHPIGHLAKVQLVDRHRLGAKLLATTGDSNAAEQTKSAVAAARAFGSPYHLALALLDQAELLLRDRELDAASAAAAEARTIGQRLRCQPVLDRAAAIVRDEVAVATEAANLV